MAAVPLLWLKSLRSTPTRRVTEPDREKAWTWVWAGLVTLAIATVLVAFPSMATSLWNHAVDPENPLRGWADTLAIAAYLLLALIVFIVYWLPRRRQNRPFALVGGLFGAVLAIVLGMAGYLPCSGGEARLWTATFQTMALFVGSVQYPFGQVGGTCPATMPISVQIGRIIALAVALGALIAVALYLFADQRDRLYVRSVRRLVVVTGLTEETEPFIRQLARQHDGSARARAWRRYPDPVVKDKVRASIDNDNVSKAHVVVVHPNRDSRLIPGLRQAGVKLLVGDPRDLADLGLVRAARRVRAVYALSPDRDENIDVAEAMQKLIADGHPPAGSSPTLLRVRIDDSRDAEAYRRRSMTRSTRTVIEDAFNPAEVTSHELAEVAFRENSDLLVILGATRFASSLLDELAQTYRERVALTQGARVFAPPIVVLDPMAESVALDHEHRQQAYGNDVLPIIAVETEITEAVLLSVIRDSTYGDATIRRPFVLDSRIGESSSSLLAHRLIQEYELGNAAYHDPGVSGVDSDEPVLGLHRYHPSLLLRGRIPDDRWMRAARLMHEQYLAAHGVKATRHGSYPWVLLSDFYRVSNLRALTNVMQRAGKLDDRPRVWAPQFEGQQPEQLEDWELESLIPHEHDDWYEYYTKQGWTLGEKHPEDENAKVDPNLMPFKDLPDDCDGMAVLRSLENWETSSTEPVPEWFCGVHADPQQCQIPTTRTTVVDRTRRTVTSAARLLRILGYHPYLATPKHSVAERADLRGAQFRRIDSADERDTSVIYFSAELKHAEATVNGDTTVTAYPGEFWAANSPQDLSVPHSDKRWRVTATERRRAYIQVGDNTFRRSGVVSARRAKPEEDLPNLTDDGKEASAHWIVTDDFGDVWTLADAEFTRHYEAVVD